MLVHEVVAREARRRRRHHARHRDARGDRVLPEPRRARSTPRRRGRRAAAVQRAQLRCAHEPRQRRACRRRAGGARARRAGRPQRRDPGRARRHQELDAPARDVPQPRPRHARLRRSRRRVAIYRRPVRRHAPETEFDVRGRSDLPRVDIAYSYAGADGAAIAAFVAAGARAIVSASMAPGMTTRARDGRAPRGAAPRRPGRAVESRGERRVLPRTTLRERGLVVADNLTRRRRASSRCWR